jgi:tRNA (guanine-N7-)-methyltransferase
VARVLKYDIPGTDWRIPLDEACERGFCDVFASDVARPSPLVVEIGFGRGEFLMDLALRHPEQAFVGIEVSFKRTLKMARRLARTELRNVRLVEGTAEAEAVLRDALEDASVSRFWINFPDPWPKKRHFKRRLLQPPFAALLARRLVPGGELHVATDHPGYAEWIDLVLSKTPGLENLAAPRPFLREAPDDRRPTAYELEWRALGRGLFFFRYRRPG